MNIEEFRDHCLALPLVEECQPFGDDVLVYKVAGKVFALISISDYAKGVSLKCDPERAVELREQYAAIVPGFHLNKMHWNTIMPEQSLPLGLLPELINHSYAMVIKGMPKKRKIELGL